MNTNKKGLCLLLCVLLMIPILTATAGTSTEKTANTANTAADTANAVTYYVNTANQGALNVRSSPFAPAENVIGALQYGAAVSVVSFTEDQNWAMIYYGSRTAYVMTRYLSRTRPGSGSVTPARKVETMEDINRVFRSMRKVSYNVVTRPARASGWVNLRWAPSLDAEVIQRCYDGYQLHVIQQSGSWAMAEDRNTGNVGFISTQYIVATGSGSSPYPYTYEDELTPDVLNPELP